MQNQKIKNSTQEHLDLEDITGDLSILKNGWVAMVLTTTAVNFDILSEAEQDATIYAYAALLNSLTFPVQILIRSKRADITSYYQHLVEAERNQPNPDLKVQIRKYMDFIQTTVQQKTILDKRFYLVITYAPTPKGVRGAKKAQVNVKNKQELVNDAQIALAPKRDHLIKQAARLGLIARQLTTKEIIELYYDIYNPAPTGTQRVLLDTASYTTPIIEPAVENPEPATNPEATLEHKKRGEEVEQNPYADSLPQVSSDSSASRVSPQMQESLKNLQEAALKASSGAGGQNKQ